MPRAREAVLLGVGVVALALLCWRFGLADVTAAFARVRWGYLLAYFGLASAVVLGWSLRWRLVARAVGGSPRLGRLVTARLAGDAVGFLFPSGRLAGDPVRMALLYARGTDAARAGAGVAIDRIFEIIANTFCAVSYTMIFALAHTGGLARPIWVFIGAMVLLLAALAAFVEMARRGLHPLAPLYGTVMQARVPSLRRWGAVLRETEGHITSFLRDHSWVFIEGIAASLALEALGIAEYWFLLAAFEVTLDFPTLLMVLVATGIARAVPAPAALGILEASEVTVVAVGGGAGGVGFVVAMVLRLHETIWMTVGLIVLSAQGVSLSRLRLGAERKVAV